MIVHGHTQLTATVVVRLVGGPVPVEELGAIREAELVVTAVGHDLALANDADPHSGGEGAVGEQLRSNIVVGVFILNLRQKHAITLAEGLGLVPGHGGTLIRNVGKVAKTTDGLSRCGYQTKKMWL